MAITNRFALLRRFAMAAPPRAIVFDLDGTLVDSAGDIRRALNRLLAEEGRRPISLAETRSVIGDGVPKVVERGFAKTGPRPDAAALGGLVERFRGLYAAEATRTTRPYPGVIETLARLEAEGHRLALCTNKFVGLAQQILDALGLAGFFRVVIGADSTPARKPDPLPLTTALARLGASPERAVMVGDSAVDVTTARRAGLPVVAVTYGYPRMAPERLGADRLIETFPGLPAALASL